LEIILESLKYSRKNIDSSDIYPNYVIKQEQMRKIETVNSKIQNLLKEKK